MVAQRACRSSTRANRSKTETSLDLSNKAVTGENRNQQMPWMGRSAKIATTTKPQSSDSSKSRSRFFVLEVNDEMDLEKPISVDKENLAKIGESSEKLRDLRQVNQVNNETAWEALNEGEKSAEFSQ